MEYTLSFPGIEKKKRRARKDLVARQQRRLEEVAGQPSRYPSTSTSTDVYKSAKERRQKPDKENKRVVEEKEREKKKKKAVCRVESWKSSSE